ncbi:MAG: hypothetical protein K1X64_03045 [Myxococcaceae bacterium]|nr:hypothetical protein [Myxococcaceae bacterium]
MNRKALALGAVLGFLVAVVPSCGGNSKCSAANCSTGCCDAKGVCIKDNKNKENATCGNNGNACVDCTASSKTCDAATLACTGGTGTGGGMGGTGGGTGGTGGGTTGTCTAANCAGCCSGNTCIPYLRQDSTSCGSAGAACAACTTGMTCSHSAQGCTTPMVVDAGPEVEKTGIACQTDAECNGGNPANYLKCRKITALGDAGYEGGYCTKDCGKDTTAETCADDSTCINAGASLGEPTPFCAKNCSGPNDCRTPGYKCYAIDMDVSVCWLDPLPDVKIDGGPVPTTIGNACTNPADCQMPPSVGVNCIGENLPLSDGGTVASGFVGGYCTRDDCDQSGHECSTDGGAICISFNGGDFNQCMRHCTPDGGQSSCRTNYVCEALGLADGGVAPDGICYPNCNNVQGWCGQGGTCLPSGFCQ